MEDLLFGHGKREFCDQIEDSTIQDAVQGLKECINLLFGDNERRRQTHDIAIVFRKSHQDIEVFQQRLPDEAANTAFQTMIQGGYQVPQTRGQALADVVELDAYHKPPSTNFLDQYGIFFLQRFQTREEMMTRNPAILHQILVV